MKMSRKQFTAVAARALEELPLEFKPYLENCMLLVEPFPRPELLRDLGVPEDEGLYGLYEGGGLLEEHFGEAAQLPARVTLFYEPLLEDFDDEAELIHEIQTTVLHEIGHHFGLDEDRLAELGFA